MDVLPADRSATLIGRVLDPEQGGPCAVATRRDTAADLSAQQATMSALLERSDAVEVVRSAVGGRTWAWEELLGNTLAGVWDRPHLLAPVDLQVIKAAGVTFAQSLLERVIEERASGDPAQAAEIRRQMTDVVGTSTAQVRPGSPEAARAKEVL